MIIQCLGTGSKGNHYKIINKQGKILLVELGIPLNEILKDLDLDNVSGAIVSHNHKDHNYNDNVKRLASFGMPIITTQNGVVGKRVDLDGFSIIPLPCKHNIKCFGYLIKVDNTIIMFATDTKDLPKVANIKVDVFMVEINYIESMVNRVLSTMAYDNMKLNYESRVLITHNSLENGITYFENLKYKPSAILTIHKSDNPNHYNQQVVMDKLKPFAIKVDSLSNGSIFEIE